MSSIKPDIEIARAAKIHPIKNVLAKLNVPDGPETFMPIGCYIAKINLIPNTFFNFFVDLKCIR